MTVFGLMKNGCILLIEYGGFRVQSPITDGSYQRRWKYGTLSFGV